MLAELWRVSPQPGPPAPLPPCGCSIPELFAALCHVGAPSACSTHTQLPAGIPPCSTHPWDALTPVSPGRKGNFMLRQCCFPSCVCVHAPRQSLPDARGTKSSAHRHQRAADSKLLPSPRAAPSCWHLLGPLHLLTRVCAAARICCLLLAARWISSPLSLEGRRTRRGVGSCRC